MTAVKELPIRKPDNEFIETDSLLEELYTFYPLETLNSMLSEKPDATSLVTWNVSLNDYQAIVRRAIELVKYD